MTKIVKNIEFTSQNATAFDASNAKLLANINEPDQYVYPLPESFKDTLLNLHEIVVGLPRFTGDMLNDLSQYSSSIGNKKDDIRASEGTFIPSLKSYGITNKAGFIISLANEDLEIIRSHKFLIVDLETTHLTRYSPPLQWNKTTKLGDKTSLGAAFNLKRGEYIKEESSIPRIRIVSVGFPDTETGAIHGFAWDMDCLSEEEQLRLLTEIGMAYCWIGQNLTFDLSWFASYGISAQPQYILDAMTVVRDINPMLLHKMAESMAEQMQYSPEDDDGSLANEKAIAYISKRLKIGKPSYAMTDIALASDLDLPDKVWQAPVNWSIPSDSLRPEQYAYCMDDVSDPLNIIRACLADFFARESKTFVSTLFDDMPAEDVLASVFYISQHRKPYEKIESALRVDPKEWKLTSYYAVTKASLVFAQMHGNGAPFDVETARNNQLKTMERITALADKVAENHHLAPFVTQLKSTDDGETNDMKLALRRAIHEYLGNPIPPNATSEDMDPYETEWDKTTAGQTSLGAKSLIITRVNGNTLDSIPFVKDFNKLRAEKKTYGMVSDYIVRASNPVGGNRLHSLVSPVAATSRTTSAEPNLQNIKRGPEARGQFKVVLESASETGKNALPLDTQWLDTVYAWVKQYYHEQDKEYILNEIGKLDNNSPRVIVASDFSAVEMRIAAALGERAWHEFNSDSYVSPIEATSSHAEREFLRKEHRIARDLADAYTALDEPTPYIRDALTGKWTQHMPTIYRSEPARSEEGKIILDPTGLPLMCTSESSQDSLSKYCFEVGKFGKPAEDYYYLNRIRLAWWASRVKRAGGPVLSKVFANGIDPHLSTGLRMEDPKLQVLEYLLAMSKEEQSQLKKTKKAARDAAKPVNFGLLYGLAAPGLWRSGRVAYGLDWTLEEADSARSIWMDTYPELPFWHTWTRTAYRIVAKKAWSKAKFGGGGFDRKKSPIPFATTLTGRPLYSIQPQQTLNYQDQGTGAEIALRAIADMPEWLSSRMVLFVHDEVATELPAVLAEFGKNIMEKVMVEAGTKILDMGYVSIPVEVETKYADHWEH